MTDNICNTLFRPEILAMSAYKVADAHNLIKLDAMENPYSWPEDIKQKWLDTIKSCPVNRYPDPQAEQLTQVLKKTNQIPEQSGILLGNGSDEIIQILLMALNSNASVLAPEPGFVMYRQIAKSLGLDYHGIPLLAESFALDMPAMLTAIEKFKPGVIFLAYPNNPTGNLFSEDDIKTLLSKTSGLVVIDEAYAPFTSATFIDKLPDYSNLLVMRTVSKLGLAGLRLGFLAGAETIIEELNKIRLPYNINSLTQITAEFALNHIDFLEKQTRSICQQRNQVFAQLNKLDDLTVWPSEANFIIFKSQTQSADDIFNALKQHGILIKNLSPQGGLLADCLRVTIGTEAENKLFIKALTAILASSV